MKSLIITNRKIFKKMSVILCVMLLFSMMSCNYTFATEDENAGISLQGIRTGVPYTGDNYLKIKNIEYITPTYTYNADKNFYDLGENTANINPDVLAVTSSAITLPREISGMKIAFDYVNGAGTFISQWNVATNSSFNITFTDKNNSQNIFQAYSDFNAENQTLIISSYLLNPNTTYTVTARCLSLTGDYSVPANLFDFTTGEAGEIPGVENPIMINNAENLYNMRNIPNWNYKKYQLSSDIDMNEMPNGIKAGFTDDSNWNPPQYDTSVYGLNLGEQPHFNGSIDGREYKIKNLKDIQGLSSGTNLSVGLFQRVANATISDITFCDAIVKGYDDGHDGPTLNLNSGILAGNMNGKYNLIIKNVNIEGAEITGTMCGGFVGRTDSIDSFKISDCVLNNLKLNSVNGSSQCAGGFIGKGNGNIYDEENYVKDCEINNLQIKVAEGSTYPGTYGGVAGQFSKANVTNVIVSNPIIIIPTLNASCKVGGIAGSITNTKVSNCQVLNLDLSNVIITKTAGSVGGLVSSVSTSGEANSNLVTIKNKCPDENKASYTEFVTKNYNKLLDSESDSYYVNENNQMYGAKVINPNISYYDISLSLEPVAAAQSLSNKDANGAGVAIVARTKDADYIADTVDAGKKYSELTAEQQADVDEKISAGGIVVEDFKPITLSWKVADNSPVSQAVTFTENETATGASIKCTSGTSGKILAVAVVNGVEVGAGVDDSGNIIPVEVDYSYISSGSTGGSGGSSTRPSHTVTPSTNSGSGSGAGNDNPETTTETDENGTVTETTNSADGTQTVVETKPDGNKNVSISVPESVSTPGQETVVNTPAANVTLPAELAGKPVDISINVAPAENGSNSQLGAVTVEVKSDGAPVSEPVKINVNIANILNGNDNGGSNTGNSNAPGSNGGSNLPQITQPQVVAYVDGKVVMNAYVSGSELVLPGFAGGTVTLVDNSRSYSDIANGFWGKTGVDFVSARELFMGVTDSEFAPDSPMTRSMMATVLYRFNGQNGTWADGGFRDVVADSWYADAVNWAADNSVVLGVGEEMFAPDGLITREQLAAMLYRYNGSKPVSGNLDAFADASQVGDYAADAMIWAVENGLMSGVGDNMLDPQGNATRAQVATMLMRYCQL